MSDPLGKFPPDRFARLIAPHLGALRHEVTVGPGAGLDCAIVKLTTNYRSHKGIVEKHNRWMASATWLNPRGEPLPKPLSLPSAKPPQTGSTSLLISNHKSRREW